MKLREIRTTKSETNFGQTESHNCSINISHHTFSLLYEKYKDPITSIIRELSSNALDSHVAANKHNVKFDIHLPSFLEPYFYVKDYGIGMSKETLLNVYSILCLSTKTESNLYDGCNGIGSKTPLSYIDNMSIESIYDGDKYSCIVYIENGIPTIRFISEEKTNECNGFKIEFSVKIDDIGVFHDKAKYVIPFLSNTPNIINSSSECFDIKKKIVYDDDIILYDCDAGADFCKKNENRYNTYNRFYKNLRLIRQGNIVYPLISLSPLFKNENTIHEIFNYINKVTKTNVLIIDFPVGSLDVTLTKEEVQLNDKNNETIKNKLDTFITSFKKKSTELIDDIFNNKDKKSICDPHIHDLNNLINHDLLKTIYNDRSVIKFLKENFSLYKYDDNRLYNLTNRYNFIFNQSFGYYVKDNERTILCLIDQSKYKDKLKQFLNKENIRYIFTLHYFIPDDIKKCDEILNHLSTNTYLQYEVIKISDLDDIKKPQKQSNTKTTHNLTTNNFINICKIDKDFSIINLDFNLVNIRDLDLEKSYFGRYHRSLNSLYNIFFDNTHDDVKNNLSFIAKLYNTFAKKDDNIYLYTPNHRKRIPKESKNIIDFFNDRVFCNNDNMFIDERYFNIIDSIITTKDEYLKYLILKFISIATNDEFIKNSLINNTIKLQSCVPTIDFYKRIIEILKNDKKIIDSKITKRYISNYYKLVNVYDCFTKYFINGAEKYYHTPTYYDGYGKKNIVPNINILISQLLPIVDKELSNDSINHFEFKLKSKGILF